MADRDVSFESPLGFVRAGLEESVVSVACLAISLTKCTWLWLYLDGVFKYRDVLHKARFAALRHFLDCPGHLIDRRGFTCFQSINPCHAPQSCFFIFFITRSWSRSGYIHTYVVNQTVRSRLSTTVRITVPNFVGISEALRFNKLCITQ